MYWDTTNNHLLTALFDQPRLGVVSDFDGTLSPIVPDRDAAQITPRNRQLLAALNERLALMALVSGRGAADLAQRAGVPGVVCIGNHGMERWQAGQSVWVEAVRAHRPALEGFMRAAKLGAGMELEDKGATLAIHYRHADPSDVEDYTARLAALAAQHGLRFSSGRMVWEVRPPLDINKGTALQALVREYRLDAVLFIGDDTTDADAMRVARTLRSRGACYGLAVGVESAEMPAPVREHADLLARDVGDVENLLAYVLARLETAR